MRALLLIDLEQYDADDPDLSKRQPEQYLESEFHVSGALRSMGMDVLSVPATADFVAMMQAVRRARPDIVFNLVEHVGGQRSGDSIVASLLESDGLAYTGASARALTIARDKFLSKQIVASAGVSVPKCILSDGRSTTDPVTIPFPAIVKPSALDGSEGITANSYVNTQSELRREIKRVVRKFAMPAICEEYIDGRELIVTLSGVEKISVDSIRELVFPERAEIGFATERVKFDQGYKKRNGIYYRTPNRLLASLDGKVERAARAAYRALEIKSYAKLEFRVRGSDVIFIEANPNSLLSRNAKTTDFAKIGYERFVAKIVRMALTQRGRKSGRNR